MQSIHLIPYTLLSFAMFLFVFRRSLAHIAWPARAAVNWRSGCLGDEVNEESSRVPYGEVVHSGFNVDHLLVSTLHKPPLRLECLTVLVSGFPARYPLNSP